MDQSGDDIGFCGSKRDSDATNFIWFKTKVTRFNLNSFTFSCIDLKLNVASNTSLILKLDLLVSGGLVGNESEIDQRFELDISCWLQGVQKQLELLVVALALDLDYIVEVSLSISLEANVHLDC